MGFWHVFISSIMHVTKVRVISVFLSLHICLRGIYKCIYMYVYVYNFDLVGYLANLMVHDNDVA